MPLTGNTLITCEADLTILEVDREDEPSVMWKLKMNQPQEERSKDDAKIERAERIADLILDTPGDTDGDWDLDMIDFSMAQVGFTGQGEFWIGFPYSLSKMDDDNDIDSSDINQLITWMTGPGL